VAAWRQAPKQLINQVDKLAAIVDPLSIPPAIMSDLNKVEKENDVVTETRDPVGKRDGSISDDDSGAVPVVDLANNTSGKVRNPLAGLSRNKLMANVEAFTREKGLDEHLELFKRGALLAQNPAGVSTLEELSEDERRAVEYEYTHKWSHPTMLYFTIILCSIGAATQGWDQTGSNGANLSFPAEFGIAAQPGEPNYERDGWLDGLVNSAPYIGSAACGCWLSDPFNNIIGRRGVIFLTALILIATPIASGFTHSWQTLFVVRLILGIGMGMKGSTVPIFAAENAPASIRGALVMSWQFWSKWIFLTV
jgi:hypothetical protein